MSRAIKAIRFDTPAAARSFRKLPADAQAALRAKLEAYRVAAGGGRAKKLRAHAGVRFRAGDYRIVIEETATEIIIVAAGNRRDIYR